MRFALDATPLLGRLTGIGHYVRRLFDDLPSLALPSGEHPELVATAFTLRGRGKLAGATPAGIAVRARPAPARALRWAWERTELPPVEWLCGRVELFHGTNFVLPPMRRGVGVVSVHDLSFLRYPETVSAASLRYQALVPRSIARAAAVCTLTEAMRDEIADEYHLDRELIHVTYPGVDESWFETAAPTTAERQRLGIPDRYLLAVGTLEPRKNLRLLLRAYGELRGSDPSVPPLVLAGGQGWGPELELDTFPAGSVITTGYLDDAALHVVVAGASCLAFPSLYEGFGLPPVEALACGIPVVATDLPVTREVLGDAARLVSRGDVDAMAHALGAELTASAPNAERVAAGRARARRWTWRQCAEQTFGAYRAALSG